MKTKEVQRPAAFKVRVGKNINRVAGWLDAQSGFYSGIMEEPVKRRTALLVNLIVVCMTVAVIAADGALAVSLAAAFCAGCLVKRLNATDNE